MNESLTPRQRQVMVLLARGCTLRTIARRLNISESTLNGHRVELLRKYGMHSTAELREVAVRSFPAPDAPQRPETWLGHDIRLLAQISLNPRSALGGACRTLTKGRTLRDAAEYLLDLDHHAGEDSDDYRTILAGGAASTGAKQALLAALARDGGRDDLPLVVACCEMPLPDLVPVSFGRALPGPTTLPLAVCMLRFNGRRIQIARGPQRSVLTPKPVTEVTVSPQELPAERLKLYHAFAADWCRALEVDPTEFAKLRARHLSVPPQASVVEDLLGHRLPREFAPTL